MFHHQSAPLHNVCRDFFTGPAILLFLAQNIRIAYVKERAAAKPGRIFADQP